MIEALTPNGNGESGSKDAKATLKQVNGWLPAGGELGD